MEILRYPFDGAEILQKKRALKRELLEKPGLIDKKIAILSGSTIGDVKPILELFLLDGGIRPTFWEGGYGLFYENLVFDDGSLAAFEPDVIYIHTSSRNLREWPLPADSAEEAAAKLRAELARFEVVWDAAEKYGCPVIQNNFEMPLWRNFGNLDASDGRGRVSFVRELNGVVARRAQKSRNFYVHDLCYLAALHGLQEWCDVNAWYAYKYLCAVAHIPTLCHSLASLIKSLFGRTKKALVTDLDNTLWGGVIGEVGPEGVEFGGETPAGMAFAELQSYMKMLAGRGILLAVASKNEDEAAKAGFTRVDGVLRAEDFVAFEANWGPKPESIKKIAQDLNILPDSMVFFDDNPAERDLVRRELPEVEAPAVDAVEASIPLLDRAGYFEASALSADDLHRSEMYRENTERRKLEDSFGDYSGYLLNLDMKADISAFRPDQLERVTQLINKTNQFNLTTRRYSAAEVEARMKDENTITLAGRLEDKFGDNGITSVIIAVPNGGTDWAIELWVMSCRVFKRDLEYAMFDALVAEAKRHGAKTLTGRWLPTAKNLLTRDFYATIGFGIVEESDDERVFRYTIPENYEPMNNVIKILE